MCRDDGGSIDAFIRNAPRAFNYTIYPIFVQCYVMGRFGHEIGRFGCWLGPFWSCFFFHWGRFGDGPFWSVPVPITVMLYDGPLLCGFTVAMKGLTFHSYLNVPSRQNSSYTLMVTYLLSVT